MVASAVTQYDGNSAKVLVTPLQPTTRLPSITKLYESLNQSTAIHTSLQSTRKRGTYNQSQKLIIRKMDPKNQPQGTWNSSEKSGMLQSTSPPPPAYQESPAGYPTSFPSQPVPQGSYVQGPYPGQSVVAMQPAVFVTAAPLANPKPDYLCYSIFNMLCCCFPLGMAALVFSCSTRNANYSGQQALAEKNSKTARTLNHVGVALGIVFIVLVIILEFVVFNNR
ncbi:proline-rich transmembrane protein 1-like [Megalobrama amblycephala]|uniref:proline-rich transmembrane protein 1-like n=1 Tax=Megalobrama amblycephala TaxID=75352 RepID=UPI0020147F2F|nr:proline-rich transmembrane protein 1-like [Megalobrama amblycephala]